MFLKDSEFVTFVEFLAIIDPRTTQICTDRDGLILPLTHPLVQQNTPPLHHRCRSMWSPITKFEAEDLARERGFFGVEEWGRSEVANWDEGKIEKVKEGFSKEPLPRPEVVTY